MHLCFLSPCNPTFLSSRSSRSPLQSRRPMRLVSLPKMVAVPEKVPTSAPVTTKSMSILLPEKLSDTGVALLSERFNVVKKLDLTPEQLLSEIVNHDAIIIRSGTRMTRELIEAAPKLKVIGRAGVGVDNIDIHAATERGVLVVNAPTGNCVAAAEHTIALLCGLARLIAPADHTIKNSRWDRSKFVGVSLVDKTLGVVGLGRIGREVAKRGRGLGMNIVASDPFASEEIAAAIGVTLLPYEQVLENSDFLTLHIPLIPSTKHMINGESITKMKDGARIINAARGGIVDETALFDALESGKIAGAALDCFEFEPPSKHPDSISAKLVQHPCVLATPHLGASTKEAQLDVAVEIATAVGDSLNGDVVPTMINCPNIAPEVLKTLKPRALLCESLGRLAYYVSGRMLHGEAVVDYFIPSVSEDTRLLRTGLIKGLMEPALGVKVTIVNADNIAKTHNLNITETNHYSSATMDSEVIVTVRNSPPVEGRVTSGNPHVTRIGRFEVDLRLDGIIMAYSQDDRPGQMGLVGSILGDAGVNISSMTLARDANSSRALVLLGLDSRPSEELVNKIEKLVDDEELRPIVMEF